jgi:hypothetical protein
VNPIRTAYALVLKLTEAFVPVTDPVLERNVAALTAAEEQSEVLESVDFPLCNCAGRQAADLDDHRPACAACAADTSPAGVRTPPTVPPAGRDVPPRDLEDSDLLYTAAGALVVYADKHAHIPRLIDELCDRAAQFAAFERLHPTP